MLKRYPLISFYLLALLISWIGWAPHIAGSYGIAPFDHPAFTLTLALAAVGPAAAAWIVTTALEGKPGQRHLASQLIKWRISPIWYLAALLGPVILFASATLIDNLRNGTSLGLKAISPWFMLFPVFLSFSLQNVWEEIGWRGFALPRLQSRMSALRAASIVGVMWGLWHLPLFFIQGHPLGSESFLPWLLGAVAESIIYAWLYNSSRGSLLMVAFFHGMINAFGSLAYDGSYPGVTLAACFFAILIVIISGPAKLASGVGKGGET